MDAYDISRGLLSIASSRVADDQRGDGSGAEMAADHRETAALQAEADYQVRPSRLKELLPFR